jgi:hypothetical protein
MISVGTAWSIVGLMADFVGAMLLLWPMIRPGRFSRRFDTAEYVQSPKTRGGALLLLFGFALQAIGVYLSGYGGR